MDNNTTQVILAIITALTPIIILVVTYQQNKRLAKLKDNVQEYRKEVDGHMTKLIQKTEEVAIAQEQVRKLEKPPTVVVVPGGPIASVAPSVAENPLSTTETKKK